MFLLGIEIDLLVWFLWLFMGVELFRIRVKEFIFIVFFFCCRFVIYSRVRGVWLVCVFGCLDCFKYLVLLFRKYYYLGVFIYVFI